MKDKDFWNDVAKYGALLGILMGASRILKMSMYLSGNLTYMLLTILIGLLFAFIFCLILIKAAKARAAKVDPILGFSYGQGVSYMILVSLFAAVPVTLLYYIYEYTIVGFDNSILQQTRVATDIFNSYAQIMTKDQMKDAEQYIKLIKEQPKLSIFEMLYGTMFSYAFIGGIVGVLFAGLAKRKPQIFDKEEI